MACKSERRARRILAENSHVWAAAAHCAVRAMQQSARDNGEKFPIATDTIRNAFYMKDVLLGARNPDEALQLCKEMNFVFNVGGFKLCKCQSNCRNMLSFRVKDVDIENMSNA